MKILNLFAGLGGNRTLWADVEVTAVEHNPKIAALYQKRFPQDRVMVQNVYDFLRDPKNPLDYDLIWASPPCYTHSRTQKTFGNKRVRGPIPQMDEIYGLMVWFQYNACEDYIIENVQPYYVTLVKPTAKVGRHLIWATFPITNRNPRGNLYAGDYVKVPDHVLIQKYQLEDIRADLLQIPDGSYLGRGRRGIIIRNCVNPWIGAYILEEYKRSKTTLLSFIGGGRE